MTRVFHLTCHDLAVSFKNKTILLMVFVPLFVFLTLTMVDVPGKSAAVHLGILERGTYPNGEIETLASAPEGFELHRVKSADEGRKLLEQKAFDGLLLPGAQSAEAPVLLVESKSSVKTLTILEGLSQMQRAVEAKQSQSWVGGVEALQKEQGITNQTLPIWSLMLVLLVGLLVLPPQIADEKERHHLLGLLQTPMKESEWLIAKVLTGMILTLGSISILHLVGGFTIDHMPSYWIFILAGSFCFSSLGVLLGFLCRTQASARALGVFVYLPHLLPSALADVSTKLNRIAMVIPSYPFFVPLRAIVLEGRDVGAFPWQLMSLPVVGIVACIAAYTLLKRRWLM